MDNARDPTEDGETDVDEEVGVAAGLEEDRDRREEYCQGVEADVGSGGRHVDDVCGVLCLVEILKSLFRWRKAESWWSMLAINADGKEKEEDDDGADSALRLCLCTRFLKHVCSRETGLVMTDSQELRGQTDVTGKAKANFRG